MDIKRIGQLVIVAGLIMVLFNSCETGFDFERKNYMPVETEFYRMDFEVEPKDKSGFQIFGEKFFDVDLTYVLEEAGYEADRIEEIVITEAIVNLRDTEDHENFNNLRFIELTLYNDDLGERLIASSDPVPSDKISINLDLEQIDVLSYFNEDRFMLSAQGFLKDRINREMKLHAMVKFRLTVRI
jgi:hypothetical protein